MGSWQWGITANTADGDAGWRFLEFLLQDEQVRQISTANGAIPAKSQRGQELDVVRPRAATSTCTSDSCEGGTARPRPQTPAYPAITSAFSVAVREIFAGRPVKPALDAAARRIEKDLRGARGLSRSRAMTRPRTAARPYRRCSRDCASAPS